MYVGIHIYICTHRVWILMMHHMVCLCPTVTQASFLYQGRPLWSCFADCLVRHECVDMWSGNTKEFECCRGICVLKRSICCIKRPSKFCNVLPNHPLPLVDFTELLVSAPPPLGNWQLICNTISTLTTILYFKCNRICICTSCVLQIF